MLFRWHGLPNMFGSIAKELSNLPCLKSSWKWKLSWFVQCPQLTFSLVFLAYGRSSVLLMWPRLQSRSSRRSLISGKCRLIWTSLKLSVISWCLHAIAQRWRRRPTLSSLPSTWRCFVGICLRSRRWRCEKRSHANAQRHVVKRDG